MVEIEIGRVPPTVATARDLPTRHLGCTDALTRSQGIALVAIATAATAAPAPAPAPAPDLSDHTHVTGFLDDDKLETNLDVRDVGHIY